MNTTAELAECRLRLAELTGAVSRWCSLTGHMPDTVKARSKQAAELRAFAEYLEHLAARKHHKSQPLTFDT